MENFSAKKKKKKTEGKGSNSFRRREGGEVGWRIKCWDDVFFFMILWL